MSRIGWRVGRVGPEGVWEYLDNTDDLFYREGVFGFTRRADANKRAHEYKGVDMIYVISPRGTKYRPTMRNKTNPNFIFDSIVVMEAHLRSEKDLELRAEMSAVFKNMLLNFIEVHGLWCLSSVLHTRRLLELITTYEVITPTELMLRLKYGKT